MRSETILYAICVLLLAASVMVFAYSALCIINWRKQVTSRLDVLETEVNALRIEVKHAARMVEINDDAVEKFAESNADILKLNDDLIKNNQELTSALNELLLRRDDNDIPAT